MNTKQIKGQSQVITSWCNLEALTAIMYGVLCCVAARTANELGQYEE